MQTYEQHPNTKLATIVLSIIVVAGAVLLLDHFKASTSSQQVIARTTPSVVVPSTTAPTDTPSSSSSTMPTQDSTTGYKDGTYSASSTYYVPHGSESIQVSLTLQSGAVSGVSIQNSENDNDSAQYQEDFAASYKTYVVGQKISGLQLSTIAGASDTTQGFNDALSSIVAQAQS